MIRPKKKDIFGIHDPLGLRYLLKLRVGLSLLRYHKKCHNFIDTPSAICLCNNGIEDINNFLFFCPFFAIHRATLVRNVIQILQKYNLNHLGNQSHLYLYGHPIINLADNRIINNKIHKRKSTFFNVRLFPPALSPTQPMGFCHNHQSYRFYWLMVYMYVSLVFKLFFIFILLFYVCNFLDCHGFG